MVNANRIIFYLLLFTSCNSYLSIEKRTYREGYYVEWFSKNKNNLSRCIQKIQRETQANSDSVSDADNAFFSANNDRQVKNILIENKPIPVSPIVYYEDTLKKKRKKHGNFKFDELYDTTNHKRKTNPFAILGLVVSVAALLYFPAQIIAFIFSIVGLRQIDKHPDRYDGRTLALIGSIISGVIIGVLGFLYLLGLFL